MNHTPTLVSGSEDQCLVCLCYESFKFKRCAAALWSYQHANMLTRTTLTYWWVGIMIIVNALVCSLAPQQYMQYISTKLIWKLWALKPEPEAHRVVNESSLNSCSCRFTTGPYLRNKETSARTPIFPAGTRVSLEDWRHYIPPKTSLLRLQYFVQVQEKLNEAITVFCCD